MYAMCKAIEIHIVYCPVSQYFCSCIHRLPDWANTLSFYVEVSCITGNKVIEEIHVFSRFRLCHVARKASLTGRSRQNDWLEGSSRTLASACLDQVVGRQSQL